MATICGSCHCTFGRTISQAIGAATEGIFVSEFEQGEIGPDLFRQARKFGLEGLCLNAGIVLIAPVGRPIVF